MNRSRLYPEIEVERYELTDLNWRRTGSNSQCCEFMRIFSAMGGGLLVILRRCR